MSFLARVNARLTLLFNRLLFAWPQASASTSSRLEDDPCITVSVRLIMSLKVSVNIGLLATDIERVKTHIDPVWVGLARHGLVIPFLC